MSIVGRGTKFDPNGIIALREGSFSNNLLSVWEEKATPSQDTIDKRNALARKGTAETQLKCSQLLLQIEQCQNQIRRLCQERPRNDFLIKTNIRRKKLLQVQLNQLQPIADNLEHVGGSVDAAKVVMKAVETTKLFHDNLSLYNSAVDDGDASYLQTDVADQIKRTTNGGSIMGQTVDDEQEKVERELEEDVDAAIDAEFESMFPNDILKLPKEGTGERGSGSPGRRRPTKVLVAEGGAHSSSSSGRRRGGGGGGSGEVAVVVSKSSKKKKAKDSNTHVDEDRESTPSPRARMSANHSPRSAEGEPSDTNNIVLSLPSVPDHTYPRKSSKGRLGGMPHSELGLIQEEEEEETLSPGRKKKKKSKKPSTGETPTSVVGKIKKSRTTMTEEDLCDELLREDL